jgi:Ca2+-binding RTX toxin-like protein
MPRSISTIATRICLGPRLSLLRSPTLSIAISPHTAARDGVGHHLRRQRSIRGGNASGSGDDILDLGPDGGVAVGDHNTSGSATGAGDDELTGGSADDILVGDSAADGTVTDAGDDELEGRGGNDRLFGDNVNAVGAVTTIGTVGGDDQLEGDPGHDALFGGPANDSLNGGANTDSCDGEDGTDTFAKCETVTGLP